eukprot:2686891-Pyramimonas_sp.AAC.1
MHRDEQKLIDWRKGDSTCNNPFPSSSHERRSLNQTVNELNKTAVPPEDSRASSPALAEAPDDDAQPAFAVQDRGEASW